MVEGLAGEGRGLVDAPHRAPFGDDAGRGLHEAVESVPPGPGPALGPRTQGDVDDPRPALRHRLRRVAERGEPAGAESLHEDIGALDKGVEGTAIGGVAEVDVRAALATAAVHREHGDLGELRGVDAEHVRAVCGEGAAADRSRDDPGEVGHPHLGERPVARGERTRGCIPESRDLDDGDGGEGRGLGVGGPFGAGTKGVAGESARRERVL